MRQIRQLRQGLKVPDVQSATPPNRNPGTRRAEGNLRALRPLPEDSVARHPQRAQHGSHYISVISEESAGIAWHRRWGFLHGPGAAWGGIGRNRDQTRCADSATERTGQPGRMWPS